MKYKLSDPSLVCCCSFINGDWHDSEAFFDVINPASEETIAKICEVTSLQLELAINSAAKVQGAWQKLSYSTRSEILMNWQSLILENLADLGKILTMEQGKVNAEARAEIAHAADYIRVYAQQNSIMDSPEAINALDNQDAKVYRRAIGLVTAITPWNFPCSMVIRKAAAALAAGCSFVLKPSELTPLTALALASLAKQAGIPNGVFNVVVGSNAQAIGEILTQHPKVAKFSFTGSTLIGKKLLQQCALGVKRTSMELGGNAPFVVFADADLNIALDAAMASKFRNSGQTCVSSNRFIVHKDVANDFVNQLKTRIEKLHIGSGDDPLAEIGPLINQRAVDKVGRLVNEAIEQGARLILGGKRAARKGYFFEPTLLENVRPEMTIFNREIFGPVIAIVTFDSDTEALKLANCTDLGLCAYVFTSCENKIAAIGSQLKVGMLGINEGRLSNPESPFGGVKQSGMGREGGRYGVEEYLDYQYVCRITTSSRS